MLRSITLKNFRAFRHQHFEFSKVNVFVGPNNSGKSSAISALNMLAQTHGERAISSGPIVLNGQFDTLGTFIDVIHGNRSNTPFGIEFCIDEFTVKIDFKYRQQRREIEIVKYDLLEGATSIFSYAVKKDSFTIKLRGEDFDSLDMPYRKRRPDFLAFVPLNRFSPFLLSSDSYEKMEPQLREKLRQIDRILARARTRINETFSNYDSISPFRDRPQRTYLYSGEVYSRIGTTGSNMASILSATSSRRGSEGRVFLAEISRWLKVSGIAEEVKIRALTPRHFEIVLSDIGGGYHNICDSVFGCSQVLPVLTAALNMFGEARTGTSKRHGLLVVQEPEIHLHPNAQASLASFFARLMQPSGMLVLETHSDNLVLRLARHVAEGLLSPDDIRVFFVHKKDGIATVKSMRITDDGKFEPNWPGGFFPQRQEESLNLARAAFQSKRSNLELSDAEKRSYPEER
jgi:predicted ATPase